ncbi:MAG: bacterial Ig-like domain-containing protein [Ruminococcus sp.]|nr:bacterial Ig-like domain-containing protein [Ruminococcus sp.]
MKTNSKKILSVFLSLLMTFMCLTSVAVQSAGGRMIFHFSALTASAGQDIQLDILVEEKVAIKEMSNIVLTIPDGFEVTGMSETSPAFNGSISYAVSGNILNFSITSDGTVSSTNLAGSIYLHVSESCTPKAYSFDWKSTAMSCTTADGHNYTPTMNYGIVTVSDSGGTTPTNTTVTTQTTTTTTEPVKINYSVIFIDEETYQAVSGVRYNIVSYYASDPAQVVQTSGEYPQSFEFISSTAYVALSTLENAIPDGYYIPDGATRWELSAENPDLAVYLRKIETTTTTTTTTTTEPTTTTTTTITTHPLIITDVSLPTKTVYEIGEELDLSGGKYTVYDRNSYYTYDMKDNPDVDTSEFDNTKTGTYKIYVNVLNPYTSTIMTEYFEVTVTENTETQKLGDVDNDGMINAVDATLVLTEYALLSTGQTGTFTEAQKNSADIDGDGKADAVDATFILSYYAYASTGGTDDMPTWFNNTQH